MTGQATPAWGHRSANLVAAEARAPLIWGARYIAEGFDLPYDRHGWAGSDAGSRDARIAWHEVFLRGAVDSVKLGANLLREGESREQERQPWSDADDPALESVIVVRRAGGYLYVTAAIVPKGTSLLPARATNA